MTGRGGAITRRLTALERRGQAQRPERCAACGLADERPGDSRIGLRAVLGGDDPALDALPEFCIACGRRRVIRIVPDKAG